MSKEKQEYWKLFWEYTLDTTIFWEKYEEYDLVARQELWDWLHENIRQIQPLDNSVRTKMRNLLAEMEDRASGKHHVFH